MSYSIDKDIYVKNESGNLIYKMDSFSAYINTEVLHINLILILCLNSD